MVYKKQLPADAYTVGLIHVVPFEMHAITVMLDEEHGPAPLHLEEINEYTLGRIGAHSVAIIGPSQRAQRKVAIADIVGSIPATFRNWW
jgi:hypothetical protein